MWVIPGAPLEAGRGWRIWYSQSGTQDFAPQPVDVRLAGVPQALKRSDRDWNLFAAAGLSRRMGVLTVELEQPRPGKLYEIRTPEAGSFFWRSLPDQVGDGVSFILASCCWLPADKEGAYARAIEQLGKVGDTPPFKLLIGDQVYQDYPPRKPAPDMKKVFTERYEEYWGHAPYRTVLQSSPNFFTSDDHEFWNNFPERQLWIPYTWDRFREASGDAARTTYHHFQHGANPGERAYCHFAIEPVSFFVSDARSERDDIAAENPHFFSDEQWAELESWAEELQGPGVLVLAQPLFDREGGKTDRSLASFKKDYGRLCAVFDRALQKRPPHDILILTGDIHTGRYARATLAGVRGGEVHEFVASPVSRVGPFVMKAKPKRTPVRFDTEHETARRRWDVADSDRAPTVDNNIALVRMTPGTNDRIRFELGLWRVRPHSDSVYWERLIGRRRGGDVIPIFSKEIELR
jgi:hypothetical protein